MRKTLIVAGALIAAFLVAQLRPAAGAGSCSDSCDAAYAACTKSCKKSDTDCFTKCLNERGSCQAKCS